jgi:RNA polymerase sigma factor (sigma-70 family)
VATVEHVDRTLGSAAATELLYRRHGSRVLRYCLRCLRRPADAEDAVQQTFLQAHRALGRGVEPVAEATWLLTIARNVCLTRVDAIRRRARVEFAEDPNVLAASIGAEDTAPEVSAEIVEALAGLPERQRLVLFLREWQELSYAEIAFALETTESAVETLLFRARKGLAAQLGVQKRRRRGLDLAWLLGWGRSVSGVAIPKVATGVAAIVAVATVGGATTGSAPRQARPVPVAASAATAAMPVVAHAHAVTPARTRVGSHKPGTSAARHAAPASGVDSVSSGVEKAGAPADAPPARVSTPAAPATSVVWTAAGAATAVTPTASVPSTVIPATPLDPVVAPVTAVVDSTVQSAATVVPTAVATVDQAAKTVAGTTQAVTTTVSTTVPRVLPAP